MNGLHRAESDDTETNNSSNSNATKMKTPSRHNSSADSLERDRSESSSSDEGVTSNNPVSNPVYTDEEPSSDIDIDSLNKALQRASKQEQQQQRRSHINDDPKAYQPLTPQTKAMLDDKDFPTVFTGTYGQLYRMKT